MSSAAIKLWGHIYDSERGTLAVWSTGGQAQGPNGPRTKYFDYPAQAKDAAEHVRKESETGREAYFCAHLLTAPQRVKGNAAPVRTLWSEYDGAEVPNGNLKPTALVESSPGRYHAYWRLTDAIPPETAENLNERIAAATGADPSGFDLSQLLRVPGTVNHKYADRPVVRLVGIDNEHEYVPADLHNALPEKKKEKFAKAGPVGERIPPGRRNKDLVSIAGTMRRRGMGEAEILAALQVTNAGRCEPPLEAEEVAKIAASVARYEPAGEVVSISVNGHGNSQGLPKIIVNNRHLRDMTADALGAIEAANTPPEVFVRSGRLVRIQDDENGTPMITTLTDNHVKGRLARVADCLKVYKDKDEVRETRVSPPDVVVRDIQALDRFPFPPLEAVVETPVVRPDGTIFDTPGYDPATRLYYHPAPGFAPQAVPDQPTVEDRRRALAVLHEAVGEFPYADGSSAANTLALMLTGLLRQAVDLVPLALIDKPQAGTGGSLLAEVVALVGTGRPADMFGAPSRDDEWSKKLTAKFAGGSTMLIIDNVDGALYAPSLARALTSRSWTDRVLGLSEMITVRQRATWIATGNNIQLQGDLPRRCYWIRLDAKASRPWEREGFRHPDLLRWVEENRDQLVHALLTLIRSWYAAGKPKDAALPRLGSFEAWAETVGGVLAHAGVEGFLGNLEALYSKADEGGAEWEAFLDAWWRAWGKDGKTVKAVAEAATKTGGLGDALPGELAEALGKNEGSFTRKLGKALASRIGTRYGDEGLHVEETGTHRRSKVWSVFKGSDGPKSSKECEFVSFVSLFESNAGKNNKTRLHNEEIKYPPPPQTNSTNSQTHTAPVHRDPEAFAWEETT